MRNRLIELIEQKQVYGVDQEQERPNEIALLDNDVLADHLLANGVIVQAHGEWKKFQELYPRYVCTCCNHLYNNKSYKYCPNCGARMERSNE